MDIVAFNLLTGEELWRTTVRACWEVSRNSLAERLFGAKLVLPETVGAGLSSSEVETLRKSVMLVHVKDTGGDCFTLLDCKNGVQLYTLHSRQLQPN